MIAPDSIDQDLDQIAAALANCRLNFFVGAAASTPRPTDPWEPGTSMPTAGQLRTALLRASGVVSETSDPPLNRELEVFGKRGGALPEVASYFEIKDRSEYRHYLRTVFSPEVTRVREMRSKPSTSVPALIADSIARKLKNIDQSRSLSLPLILTTNFDDLIEDALATCRIPHRVFVLRETKQSRRLVEKLGTPSSRDEALHSTACILKLHGEIPAHDGDPTTFVLSETDYVRYLLNTSLERLMKNGEHVASSWRTRPTLFLGYGFGDWTMRALLRFLWGGVSQPGVRRWAVAKGFSEYQRSFLREEFGIATITMDLEQFCAQVRHRAYGD